MALSGPDCFRGIPRPSAWAGRIGLSGRRLARQKNGTAMKKMKRGSPQGSGGVPASQLIDASIEQLSDWRGEVLTRVRKLIHEADPEVVEEVKWRKPSNPGGVPVWSHDGIICTGETYKDKVKLTFAKGASLKDPAGLFNSSLDGNTRRAIDFGEGDEIDEKALRALIRAAVELNSSLPAADRQLRSGPRRKTR
jgi:hypothetical protein